MAPLRWPVLAAVALLVLGWIGFIVVRKPDAPQAPPPLSRNMIASFWSVPVGGGRARLLFRTRGSQDWFPTYRRDGSILFVRAERFGQALFARTPDGEVRRLRALPVLSQLVYSPATDEIVVWRDLALDVESLSSDRRRRLANDATTGGVWSPDGSAFAYSRRYERPELIVVRRGRPHMFRLDGGAPGPVALSPGGKRLLFSWGNQLFLLDTRTGRRRLFANDGSSFAAWSPDGRTIAYADRSGLVVRDVRTSRRTVLLREHGTVGSFSPDGRTVLYLTQKLTKSAQTPS